MRLGGDEVWVKMEDEIVPGGCAGEDAGPVRCVEGVGASFGFDEGGAALGELLPAVKSEGGEAVWLEG